MNTTSRRHQPAAQCRMALTARALLVAALTVSAAAPMRAQGRASTPGAKAMPDSSTATSNHLRSWTADNRPYVIGDIVTVVVVNRTSATANVRDVAADSRSKKLNADVQPPAGPTGASVPIDASVRFDQDGNSRRTGELLRGNEFRATVTTRVVAISPTGMLRLEGRSTLDVDRNTQDITVKGWTRPQDIAPGSNMVESSRLADASITYARKGSLGKPRTGIVSRILGMVWP